MTTSISPTHEDKAIHGEIVYYEATDGRAVVYQGEPGEESRRTGIFDHRVVPIVDGRNQALLSLEREGFELLHSPSVVDDFLDDEAVTGLYYPEVERLLKTTTGATNVHIFDHTIRIEEDSRREETLRRAPVRMAHNDYTENSGPQRVEDLVAADEQQHWLSHRFAIINVWRSIRGPAETTPLAIADARSVAADDFILTDLVYPDRVGEIYYLAHRDTHQWYYFSKMTPQEVSLIKSYDSSDDGRARFTPHTAFDNPLASADSMPRESIEVRALVSFAPAR